MFCILPCAVIKDKVTLSPVGSAAAKAKQMDTTRAQIRKLTDIEYLLNILQKGQVVMSRKVAFDNYLSSHVDLMRAYVSTYTPCNFLYGSFFGGSDIDTSKMSQKQQWAFEIVMSRYNLSSIYQAGSYNSMRVIFTETAASYKEGVKINPDLIKNVQIAYQYMNQGYQPLKRLLPYFDAVQGLTSPAVRSTYPELNKTMFEVYTSMVSCNLAYLKIEKCRHLREFKKCKEASWAVHLRLLDCKAKASTVKLNTKGTASEMLDFFELGQFFYQLLAFFFTLAEHEECKEKEQYGYVRKQFQLMIYDNIVLCEEAEKLYAVATKTLKQENDNALFGMSILAVVIEQIKKFKYRYSINVHENKMEKPILTDVIARRIGASNIWDQLDYF